MTLVAQPGFYNENPQTIGHVPGVRGGLIGQVAKIASRYAYRGIRRFGSRFFRPKKYTYRGAVGRGIAVGTGISALLNDEDESGLDSTNENPEQGFNSISQKYNRRNFHNRSRRHNHGRGCCRCCQ